MLSRSCMVTAWENDALVGFASAISDNVRWAMVTGVIIAPSHRRKGIGKRLIKALLKLPGMGVTTVIAGTPDQRDFWMECGFKDVTKDGYWLIRKVAKKRRPHKRVKRPDQ